MHGGLPLPISKVCIKSVLVEKHTYTLTHGEQKREREALSRATKLMKRSKLKAEQKSALVRAETNRFNPGLPDRSTVGSLRLDKQGLIDNH